MADNDVTNAEIAPAARIEDGAFVGAGCIIADGVLVEARATVHRSGGTGRTVVAEGVVVGAGAIVSGPLVVHRGAIIRPGAVVTEDVPAHAIVEGNPAVVVGYTAGHDTDVQLVVPPTDPLTSIDVCGASLIRLPEFKDMRGALSVIQVDAGMPFKPERVFFTYGVANRHIRGSHAHRTLHEILIALGGTITVVVDDGVRRAQVVLDEPSLALHVPPMRFLTQYAYSPTSTLAVLASDVYEEADYIRDYDTFLQVLRG